MADPDFTIVETATGPLLEETLDGPDDLPIDLTGAAGVEFRMAPTDASAAATVVAATIVDAAVGRVRVQVPTSVAGRFDYQWIATVASGQVVPFPSDRYKRLVILPLLT